MMGSAPGQIPGVSVVLNLCLGKEKIVLFKKAELDNSKCIQDVQKLYRRTELSNYVAFKGS